MTKIINMKYILTLLVLFTFIGLRAQQEHQFTQFMYNKAYYNPALAGFRGVPSLTGIYRNQWLGFDGAPTSKFLSFESPIFNQNAGMGLMIGNYEIGIMNAWNATMSYNYNIKFNETSGLRLGLSGALRTLNLDVNEEGSNPERPGDSSLPSSDETTYKGNFGVGAAFVAEKFYIGLSSPLLFPNEIGAEDGNASIAEYSPHIYGILGMNPNITDNIIFQPSVILKYVQNAPIDFDVNLSFLFNNTFLVGSSYRHGGTGFAESIDFNLFYQIVPQFGIGAAYDMHLDQVADLGTGSIEVLARYDFRAANGSNGGGTSKHKLANPRFF